MDIYGKSIREAINSGEETIENIIDIYQKMIIFLKVWKEKLTAYDEITFSYDIESLIEDLECACPDASEEDYETEEDNLNYYLNDFYNLCDSGSCWIGV